MRKINNNAVFVIVLSTLLIILTTVIVINRLNGKEIIKTNISKSYKFEKLEYNTSHIKLNNIEYDVLYTEDSLIINDKRINVSDDNKYLYAYIWYDLIIVFEYNEKDVPKMYAYDKYLNTLGQISNDDIGVFSNNEYEIDELYSLNENEISIKEINKSFIEGNNIDIINCENISDIYIEKELIYKYSYGRLSKPTSRITKRLSDIVCNS
ncbi:MAG: hypothetical protein PUD59_01870 [bacterium]|nr:hypothetical protein [bacterium]